MIRVKGRVIHRIRRGEGRHVGVHIDVVDVIFVEIAGGVVPLRDVEQDGDVHRPRVHAAAVRRVVFHVAAHDGLLDVIVSFVADEVDDACQRVVDTVLVVLHPVVKHALAHVEHHDALVFRYGDVVIYLADGVWVVCGDEIIHLRLFVVFPSVSYLVIDIGVEIADLLHHDFELIDGVLDFHAVEKYGGLADLFAQEFLELAVFGVPVFVVGRLSPIVEHRLDAEQVHEFLVRDGAHVGSQVVEVGAFGIHHFHLVFHQHRLSRRQMTHGAAGIQAYTAEYHKEDSPDVTVHFSRGNGRCIRCRE